MQEEEIVTKLTEVFRSVFSLSSLQLQPSMTAQDIDGWDSLAHISLIIAVEKAFQVRFEMPEIVSLNAVGDLVGLVHKKVNDRLV